MRQTEAGKGQKSTQLLNPLDNHKAHPAHTSNTEFTKSAGPKVNFSKKSSGAAIYLLCNSPVVRGFSGTGRLV